LAVLVAGIGILVLFKSSLRRNVETAGPPDQVFLGMQALESDAEITDAGVARVPAIGIPIDPYENDAFEKLLDESAELVSHKGMSLLDNPVHPGRATLQERMRHETPEQTFFRLADNENIAMVITALGDTPFIIGSYASDPKIVSKMTRIRKLLVDAQAEPKRVTAFLERQLTSMVATFDEKHAAFEEDYRQLNEQPMHTPDLPDMFQDRLRATAAIYVLCEADCFESLPILARLSVQGTPSTEWDPVAEGRPSTSLVCRRFVFYGMHKLATRLPQESLSRQALQAREKYMVLAKARHIPEAKPVKVTSWQAFYHEDDFRRTILRKKLAMDDRETIEITEFPALDLINDEVEQLLAALREFTQLAFPNAEVPG